MDGDDKQERGRQHQEIATCFSKRSRTSDGVRVRDSSREKGKTAERWAMVARRVW